MSEAARNAAMARYRVIQPYLEQKRSLAMVADDANVCFRTAQRWEPSGKSHRTRSVDQRNDRRPSGRHVAVRNLGGQHPVQNLAGHQYGAREGDVYRARSSSARGQRCLGGG
jgi:hypothetical protein